MKTLQNEITGSLGVNPSIELKARLEQDRILGRVGGALMAKELNLEVSEKGVSGHVGGTLSVRHKIVRCPHIECKSHHWRGV